jgi:hypothetical protein
MAIDWDKIAEKLADDTAFDLGLDGEEQPVKLTGAELKAFVAQNKSALAQRQAEIAARDTELGTLRQYQKDTTALFGQAARIASQPDPETRQTRASGPAGNLTPADRFEEEFGSDPLFSPFAKRYDEHVDRRVRENILKPFVDNELAPEFKQLRDTNLTLSRLLLEERQRREYREAGEWPEGTDLEAARKFGLERRYLVPGAEQFGLVDFRRVNDDMMTPIRHKQELEKARSEGAEEAAMRLRTNTNIVQMPNRTGGGGPKGPSRRAGGSADNVIDQALGEAAQDRETLKLLSALPK